MVHPNKFLLLIIFGNQETNTFAKVSVTKEFQWLEPAISIAPTVAKNSILGRNFSSIGTLSYFDTCEEVYFP